MKPKTTAAVLTVLEAFRLPALSRGKSAPSGGHGAASVMRRFVPAPPAFLMVVVLALFAAVSLFGGPVFAQSPPDSAPAQPTGLRVATTSHDSVSLSWNDPKDDSITGYRILRRSRDGDTYGDGQGAAAFVVIAESGPQQSYTDKSVTPRSRYVYRVKAINEHGVSERSSYANAETPAKPQPTPTPEPTPTPTPEPDPEASAPAQPTGLRVAKTSHDSVSLSWNDPKDDSITGYRILRRSRDGDTYGDGQGAAEFRAVVSDTNSAATAYTDESVTPHTRYVYRVEAVNEHGVSERSSFANAEMPAKPQPTPTPEPTPQPTPGPTPEPDPEASAPARPTLLFSAATHDQVALSWDDPKDESITGYRILRREGGDDAELQVIEENTGNAANSYTDDTVEPETRYVYRVQAINEAGLSEQSRAANAQTSAAPEEPAAPLTAPQENESTDGCENEGGKQVVACHSNGFARAKVFSDGTYRIDWTAWDGSNSDAESYTLSRVRFLYRTLDERYRIPGTCVAQRHFSIPNVFVWQCRDVGSNVFKTTSGVPTQTETLLSNSSDTTYSGSLEMLGRRTTDVQLIEVPTPAPTGLDSVPNEVVIEVPVEETEIHLFYITAHRIDGSSSRRYFSVVDSANGFFGESN